MTKEPGRVLIAEDELLIQLNLLLHLEDEGLEVDATSSADSALIQLENCHNVSVVITDVNMPGQLDGLSLARAVRQKWPDIKIVVTSGNVIDIASLPPGVVFFPKPYDVEDLAEYVSSLYPHSAGS